MSNPPTIRKDLTGRRFGRLVVLGVAVMLNSRRTVYHCQCSCGQKRAVAASSLIHGYTQSCGCLRAEKSAERMRVRQKAAIARRKRLEAEKPKPQEEEVKTWANAESAIADLAASWVWTG